MYRSSAAISLRGRTIERPAGPDPVPSLYPGAGGSTAPLFLRFRPHRLCGKRNALCLLHAAPRGCKRHRHRPVVPCSISHRPDFCQRGSCLDEKKVSGDGTGGDPSAVHGKGREGRRGSKQRGSGEEGTGEDQTMEDRYSVPCPSGIPAPCGDSPVAVRRAFVSRDSGGLRPIRHLGGRNESFRPVACPFGGGVRTLYALCRGDGLSGIDLWKTPSEDEGIGPRVHAVLGPSVRPVPREPAAGGVCNAHGLSLCPCP